MASIVKLDSKASTLVWALSMLNKSYGNIRSAIIRKQKSTQVAERRKVIRRLARPMTDDVIHSYDSAMHCPSYQLRHALWWANVITKSPACSSSYVNAHWPPANELWPPCSWIVVKIYASKQFTIVIASLWTTHHHSPVSNQWTYSHRSNDEPIRIYF